MFLFTTDHKYIPTENGVNSYQDENVINAFKCLMLKVLKIGNFDLVQRECVQYVQSVANKSLSEGLQKAINQKVLTDELYKLPYIINWINIRMLENISGVCPAVKNEISQYKKAVFSGKLADKIHDIDNSEIPANFFIRIEEKWEENIDCITIQDFIKHWSYIEIQLNIKRCLLLRKITACHGWIEIVWLLRKDDELIGVATNSAKSSALCGQLASDVFYLTIGDYPIRTLDAGK